MQVKLPKLPMADPCSHYRYEGDKYGCAALGECRPAADGAPMPECKSFHRAGRRGDTERSRAIPPPGPPPCVHLGKKTGERVLCESCKGHSELFTFACAVHGTCTLGQTGNPIAGCQDCPDHTSRPPKPKPKPLAQISFAKPCMHYGQVGRTCALHGHCREADRVERDESRDLTTCEDFRPAGGFDGAAWENLPETEETHRRLMDQAVIDALQSAPLAGEGRGIVTCGGGATYFTAAYVMVSILRKLGCTLPVEWWHIGEEEMDHRMRELAEDLGSVTVRDAVAHAKTLPDRPRMLGGWESKIFALLHSRFAECLFLDADQVPVMDPTYLFEDKRYRDVGAILWPDLLNQWGFDITDQAFRTARLPVPRKTRLPNHFNPTDYTPVESGQLLIDRTKRGAELRIAWHLADRADYWYRHSAVGEGRNLIYGDKSCFYLAFARAAKESGKQNYVTPQGCTFVGDAGGGGFCQHDLDGQLVFQHRCQPTTKWSLHGANRDSQIFNWSLCMEALAALRAQWTGAVWDWRYETPEEAAIAATALGNWWLFQPKKPQQIIELRAGGQTSDSSLRWTVRVRDGLPPCIVLTGQKKALGLLYADNYSNWLDRERDIYIMPAPPAGFESHMGRFEAALWGDIIIRNEYQLPARFEPTDLIVDIGAHIGTFARACLNRGAQFIHCVEPNPTNFTLLEKNTRAYPGVRLHNVAAWNRLEVLYLDFPDGAKHTGGGCVVDTPAGQRVQAVPVDTLLEQARRDALNGRIRYLKLDCESAEWAILRATKMLEFVDEIGGEYHLARMPADCTVEALREILEAAGFVATVEASGPEIGHFWGRRS